MSNNYKRIIQLCFGVSLLLAVMTPQAIQTENEKQANPAASWSQSQIDSRIAELEAEQVQRLALLQASNPEAKQEAASNSSNTLSQVLPNILVLLGIAAVPALLLLLWRMKKAQPVVVFDWERTVTLQPMPEFESSVIRIAKPAAINRATNQTAHSASGSRAAAAHKVGAFPEAFDAIEYEVVRVSSVVEQNDGPQSESVRLGGNDLIEQTAPLAQAKFWNSLDKTDVAISILEGVVEQERSPQSWLFLLDLYAKTNQASSYEAMRLRFKNFFNGKIPPLEQRAQGQQSLRLKDMPDLAQRINQQLPGNGIYAFLRGLLIDDRQGSRQGFEYSVYCDLVHLYEAVCEGRRIENCEAICA